MAIAKQASVNKNAASGGQLVKTAVDLFRYYRVPIDPETKRRLKKVRGNKYKFEDTGAPFDPQDTGKKPRTLKLPIMFENDMMSVDNFPIQARTLRLPKYQKVIAELRSAVADAQAGIVNFVVGRETEMVDAILKASFPPGSGVVYKGVDGYNINTASWGGNPDQCRQRLLTLLKGNVRSVTRADYEYIRKLSEDFDGTRVVEGKPKPYSPIAILNEGLQVGGGGGGGPARPAARAVGAPPGGAAPAAAPAQPASPVEDLLAIIDRCNAGIEKCEAKMRELDRHDHKPPKANAMAPSEEYAALQTVIENYKAKIRQTQTIIRSSWTVNDSFGETPYDGTGFIDFEGGRDLYKRLSLLKNPQDVYRQLRAEGGISGDTGAAPARPRAPAGTPAATPSAGAPAGGAARPAAGGAGAVSEEQIRNAYDQYKAKLAEMLTSYKRNAPKELGNSCETILELIQKPFGDIVANLRALAMAIDTFGDSMGKQDKVMILNNVVEGCGLVARPQRGGDEGVPHLVFTQTPALTDDFMSHNQQRKRRAIVIVSRLPINFGIGGVVQVPTNPDALLVDDQEGIALVKYFEDKYKEAICAKAEAMSKARAAGKPVDGQIPVESMVSISWDEAKRLGSIVSGKTQTDAVQFLQKIFKELVDKKTGAVNGRDLIKESTSRNNAEILGGSAWTTREGETKGLYHKPANLTMDEYIYSLRSDWGTMVNRINDEIDGYKDYNAVQKRLSSKLKQAEEGVIPMSGAELSALQAQASGTEQSALAHLHGMPHFIILYGSPGCGKSVYVQALANKLGFDMFDADFGQTRGSLVGQTERWFKAMLDSWKKMSNVVIRIDEIDGQVVGAEEESRASFNANQIKQLLTYFEDEKQTLVNNNIFVVATTNHPERIRGALGNRADEFMRVPDINDSASYETYLDNICKSMKLYYPKGCIYDPDNFVRSSDLWAETETFMNTLRPEFPRMADAIVNTGMNLRSLGHFVHSMLIEHMHYVLSQRKVRLYNANRNQFIEEYESHVKRDKNGQIISVTPPRVQGVPFTGDNFVRACQLTYPVDANQHRITIEERDADDQNAGSVHMGITDLARELLQQRYGGEEQAAGSAARPAPGAAVQPNFNFDAPLMPPAGDQTVASTDYYFEQLLKAGIVKEPVEPITPAKVDDLSKGQTLDKPANAPAKSGESLRQWLMRVDKGNVTDDDVVSTPGCVMMPVPGMRERIKA